MCVCVCVRACMRTCVRACVCSWVGLFPVLFTIPNPPLLYQEGVQLVTERQILANTQDIKDTYACCRQQKLRRSCGWLTDAQRFFKDDTPWHLWHQLNCRTSAQARRTIVTSTRKKNNNENNDGDNWKKVKKSQKQTHLRQKNKQDENENENYKNLDSGTHLGKDCRSCSSMFVFFCTSPFLINSDNVVQIHTLFDLFERERR